MIAPADIALVLKECDGCELYDNVKKLADDNAALREQLRWREMSKEQPKPEDSPIVVAVGDWGNVHTAVYSGFGQAWRWASTMTEATFGPNSLWFPLTLPAKGAKDE